MSKEIDLVEAMMRETADLTVRIQMDPNFTNQEFALAKVGLNNRLEILNEVVRKLRNARMKELEIQRGIV